MNTLRLRTLSLTTALIVTLAIPGMAAAQARTSTDITVDSPSNGAAVVSPFTVFAVAPTCSNQVVTAMGYSIDEGLDTIVKDVSIQTTIDAPAGLHTMHIKAWGKGGAECFTDAGVAVTPSHAINVSGIQRLTTWEWMARNDPAVGGTSTGVMSLVNFGFTRQFHTTYTNWGAELYYVVMPGDIAAHNFMYDAWVVVANPSEGVGNLQMDMNQVMANGQTVIFGFQCDGNSNTWDYTTNAGTPEHPIDQWVHSTVACNVRQWTTEIWHHVQISYSRDDSGNVTYNAVALDGVVSNINATVPSAFALGWEQVLLTNFEVDGLGASGSSVVSLNDLSVYRW